MVGFAKEDKKTVALYLVSIFVLIIYLTFIGILSFNFLTNGGALEDSRNKDKFTIYLVLAIVSTLLLFVAKFENFLSVFFNIGKILGSKTKDILDGFDAFVHETQYSLISRTFKNSWWLNPFDLTLIFLILGILMGFVNIISKTSLTNIYNFLFQQQITKTAQFGLAIEPAVYAETISLMLIVGLFWGISKFLVNKGKISIVTHYFLTLALFPVFGAFGWMGLHTLVYGGDAQGLIVTFGWGWLQCFLGMLFVSIIPSYVLHATNNAFEISKKLFSTDITAVVVFIILVVLLMILAIRISLHKNVKS